MGWPLSQDYNEAIQNPLISLTDHDLKKGEVAVGPMGLPLPRSGNFADVYQMTGGGRKWAVKCFTRFVPGLQERYAKIDEHLRQAQLPFNVGFRFHQQGIRVRGEWYPIVKMEWVEGFTLNEFVRLHADRPAYLHALLGLWVRLCKRLREAKVAHADLQHGNVLLVPGSGANKLGLKLIDYDGMWVPALAKQPSGEAGHPAYQHPARLSDQIYSADVDRFPHLVIACALRATAVGGSKLWNQFDNGDNLLFRESDFTNPGESKLAKTLWSLDDPTVTNLLSLLVLSTQHPLSKTPWLDEVLVGDQKGLLSNNVLARAAEMIGVTRRTLRQAEPAAAVLVEDETNEFANIYEDGEAPQVVNIPRKKAPSKLPWILGGTGLIAASVLVAILLLKKPKPTTEPDSDPEQTVAQVNSPLPNKPPALQHSWKPVEYGKPIQMPHTLGDWAEEGRRKSRILQTIQQPNGYSLGVWFGPDENHAILANKTHLSIYDLKAKSSDQVLAKDAGVLKKVAVSPDCRKAITVGEDRAVRAWNLKDGTERWKHELSETIDDVAISPDGKNVVAVGMELGYIEWSLEEGEFLRSQPDFKASQIQWLPSGDKMIALANKQIKIWNLKEEKATTLAENTEQKSIALTADGSKLLAYGSNARVDRWDLTSGTSLKPFPFTRNPNFITHDGDQYILSYGDGTAHLLHDYLDNLNSYASFPRTQTEVTALALSSDGRYGLVGRSNGMVDLVLATKPEMQPKTVAKNPEKTKAIELPIKDLDTRMLVAGVDLNPNGREVLVFSRQKIALFDLRTKEQLSQRDSEQPINYAHYVDGDRIFICQGESGKTQCVIWNLKEKSSIPLPIAATDMVRQVIRIPGRPYVLFYSELKGSWMLIDHNIRELHPRWPSTSDATFQVKNVAVSADGNGLAFDRNRKSVAYWDCEKGMEQHVFDQSLDIADLAVTPLGLKLVGRTTDRRLKIWDFKTGVLEKTLAFGGKGPVGNLRVLNDRLIGINTNNAITNVFDIVKEGTAAIPAERLRLDNRTIFMPTVNSLLNVHDDSKIDIVRLDLAPLESQIVASPITPKMVASRDLLKEVDYPGSPTAIDFRSDGKAILMGNDRGKLMKLSVDNLTIEKEVEADTTEILRLVALPRNRVVTLTRDWLRIWDANSLTKLREYQLSGAVDRSTCFAVNPVTSSIVLMSDKLRLFEANDSKQYFLNPPTRIDKGSTLTQFAFTPDGKFGVGRWNNDELGFWKPTTTTELMVLDNRRVPEEKMEANPQAIAVSKDGKLVILGGKTFGSLTFWETGSRRTTNNYEAHGRTNNRGVLEVTFLPNGTHFLTSGLDRKMILWDASTLKQVKEYEVLEGPKQFTISPDQQSFILCREGKLQIWKLPELPKRK